MTTSHSLPRVGRVLNRRETWTFAGVLALAALIWFAGPLVAFDGHRPLETAAARMLAIVVLLAIWGARVAWRNWHAARLNAELLAQLRSDSARAQPAGEPPQPDLDELRTRFGEAVALLKKVRFGAANRPRRGFARWVERFSQQYLYQLPWYVFIGAPGSGKTTALVNSGLTFPLAEQFGRAAIRGVGGTRHCDWWFTNDAVLIDTAGRYTTHESNRALDEGEWKGFVELLKKYRTRQPLNGAMLTISVADLVSASENERTQHAMVLRKRLQELRAQLGIQFPVYLIVTKADLLAGFTEYFSAFGRAEREQVWGFTFTLREQAAADFELHAAFDREFDLLHRRLNDALPELLAEQLDARQRELTYLLPQQFANLRDMLGQFVAEVFSASKFEPMPMLRGIYLTSGTQEGTAFDRVMGGIKRFLKIEGTPPMAQPALGGRSFFLKTLLQEHIFNEASLAGSDLSWHRRRKVRATAAYVALATVFCIVGIGWTRSYLHNSAYLDALAARVPAVNDQMRRAKIGDGSDIAQLLPVLDALREWPAAGGIEPGHPPLSYRWGLFQGDRMMAAADAAYRRELEAALLPLAARRFETALKDARADDGAYAYAVLKAYLMLYDSGHYDPVFVQAVLDLVIERSLPADVPSSERRALRAHLASLFDDRVVTSPIPMDERLVADKRDQLRRVPFAQRLYGQLIHTLRASTAPYDFNFSDAAGPDASLVFERRSGEGLGESLPGLYTPRGYWNVFDKRVDDAVSAFGREEVWVLNLDRMEVASADEAAARSRGVRQLYLNDYIKTWDDYLADLRLRGGASLAQSIQEARILSSPDSPLTRLFAAVARETTLGKEAAEGPLAAGAKTRDKVDEARSSLAQMFESGSSGNTGTGATARPEFIVDSHFAGFRAFGPNGQGSPSADPLDGVRKTIDELYSYLTATDHALRSGGMPPPSDVPDRIRAQAGRLPTPFREMLDQLSNAANGSVASAQERNVTHDAAVNVGEFCRQAIGGRYPFARGSSRDVTPADFAQLFAPGGLMDSFFQKNLQPLVDTAARPWRFNNAGQGAQALAAPVLSSFEKAAVIRDAYFPGGSHVAETTVEIKPLDMDASISEMVLDVDGQIVRYAHGPQVPATVRWPGTRGSAQVRLQIVESSGATGGIVTEGSWALHRLFDRAAVSAGRAPEQMVARFTIDGKPLTLQVTASSVRNPFRLPQLESFSCPASTS
ncbi:MAG: type VI secretion system membrane subunit TssM [Trinickia sp.]|uniref:type VI secretion system membrane subunit TssM n=1 Tax=Trinickia sp. TaxID=2571163 RepID=UPI003F7DC20F